MDAGRFEQSRRRFWVWMATPVVLIALAGFTSRLYLQHTRRVLAERLALLAAAGPLEERLRSLDALLKNVVAESGRGAETADETTRRINQAATQSGFVIRSLNVEKETAAAEGFAAQRIAVQGQGSLAATIRWLAELQRPGLLLRVETIKLTALSLPPDDTVGGEFTLVLYLSSL
jgi:hypothetical protein